MREKSRESAEEEVSAEGSALLSGVGRPAADVVEGGWVTTGVAPGSSEDVVPPEKRRDSDGSASAVE